MRISYAAASVALALTGLAAPALAQEGGLDLMQIADADHDGKVTPAEYKAFSEQGWGFVSQGKDKVKVLELDQNAQLAFFGIQPDAEGYVTQKMYLDAVPQRFQMFDANKDGSLDSDELNGRAFQQQG